MSENQFFISYSRKQLYFAEALSLALQKTGLDVWMDLQQLKPGSDWQDQIDEGLRNCSALVLIASQQSLSSPYVEGEWQAVMQSGKPIYLAYYEEGVLPSALESASVVDFRGSFQKAVGVLAAALKNASNVRERVQSPNLFRLPQKMPPMIMLFAGLLILEALFLPVQVFSSRLPILFKIILAAVGCQGLLWMTWQFLHHRVVIFVSRFVLGLLAINFFSPAAERLESLPSIEWWMLTCLPIVFLGIATYLLPYSRFGADLLRWSALGGDEGVQALRRQFNTRQFAKDEHVQMVRQQALAARDSELKDSTVVESLPGTPMSFPIGEGTRTYSLHYAGADSPVATSLRYAFNKEAMQEVTSNAQTHIVILSENLPRSRLQELLDSGFHVIPLLISNLAFHGDALLERTASLQLIDYRERSKPILTALARTLDVSLGNNQPVGFETNPQPLNSTVLPTQVLLMSIVVFFIGCWLIVSGLVSLTQSILGVAPFSILNLVGTGLGLVWIRSSLAFGRRATTNSRMVPLVLISTWLFAPLCFGSMFVTGEKLSTNASFDLAITLGSLFTHPTYWLCLICPGGLVILWTAIMWRRQLGDWLPASISKPEQGDSLKLLESFQTKGLVWVALDKSLPWAVLMVLLLGALSTFGIPAALYAVLALFGSRP